MELSKETIAGLESEFELPLYLCDLDQIGANLQQLTAEMQKHYPQTEVAYSSKANYTPAVLKHIHQLGHRIEVSSETEYRIALAAGIPASSIIVNGPLHTATFVEEALKSGGQLNIDSLAMLEQVRLACESHSDKQFSIGVRMALEGIEDNTRFGISSDQAADVIAAVDGIANCTINGLHSHYLTPGRSTASFAERTAELCELAKGAFANCNLEFINVGGGMYGSLPAELEAQFDHPIPSYAEYAEAIASTYVELFPSDGPKLIIEPGAALMADTTVFITKVMDIKKLRGETFALLNASLTNVNPTRHDKQLAIEVVHCGGEQHQQPTLAGYTCMENDIISKQHAAPVAIGDYIVVQNMGAYVQTWQPPFIVTAPGAVAHQEGAFKRAREPQTPSEMLAGFPLD